MKNEVADIGKNGKKTKSKGSKRGNYH